MFYSKEVELWKKGERVDKGGGVKVDGEPVLIKPMLVDLQPYSSEEAKRDYGYTVECTDIMFCDVEDVKINTNIIKYIKKSYDVKKIIKWDEYMEVLLNEI